MLGASPSMDVFGILFFDFFVGVVIGFERIEAIVEIGRAHV
jgi:hypothetical protein